jgi:hypothetical protein
LLALGLGVVFAAVLVRAPDEFDLAIAADERKGNGRR